ncbi:MAG: DUF3795 domain-containing protein [Armatimonadota bacterium]
MNTTSMRAPCGIDCCECDIYKASHDPEYADRLAEQWRTTWQPDATAEWFVCQGCRGDRSVCWTSDFEIYACIQDKQVEFCYECGEFSCEELEAWGSQYANHQKALEWLNDNKAVKKPAKPDP